MRLLTEFTMAKPKPVAPIPERETKLDQIVASISTKRGCSSIDLMALTGWQAHTVRAALSRLRQRGHAIKRVESAEGCRYRLIKTR